MGKDYEEIDWDNWEYDEDNNGKQEEKSPSNDEDFCVKDAHGNILTEGDTIIAIKDLKVKGSSDIKRGDKFTKMKFTDDPELIESGKMVLRTEFFKKL